jgi:hypothetical protein
MFRGAFVLVLVIGMLVGGCRKPPADDQYVVRLGEEYLGQEELSAQLASLPFTDDSLEARQQIIEQWLTNQLLFQEARRRGLRNDREVQRMLEENERSVMVGALLTQMYEAEGPAFDENDLLAYYERNRERLRLREPFVSVRYLTTPSLSGAEAARTAMTTIEPDDDQAWQEVARQHAASPNESLALSSTYVAEGRLFATTPVLRTVLSRLTPGRVSEPVEANGQYHVVHLLDRAQTGTIPELVWIEDEVRRRLLIEARKQMYARQVQRLRNEALAREELEIR